MIRFIYVALVLSILIPLELNAGRNVAFILFGSTAVPIPPPGAEFESYLYRSSCMQQQGWEIHAVPSINEAEAPSSVETVSADAQRDAFTPRLRQLIQSPSQIHDIRGEGICGMERGQQRVNMARLIEAYVLSIQETTSGLVRGDQFLFTLGAHGISNCQASMQGDGQNHYDLSRGGIIDQLNCQHRFSIRLPGCQQDILVPTQELNQRLIPVLQSLQNRGVNVALDLRSCFAGAAIHQYASAGLCAQSYSTPDSPMITCGGPGEIGANEHTAMGDGMNAFFCLGVNPLQRVGGSSDPDPLNQRRCLSRAVQSLPSRSSFRGNPPSFSELADVLRKNDRTSGQPINSDGPYWAIGSLGFLGTGATEATRQQAVQTICLPNTSTAFFDSLANHVQRITDQVTGGRCDLRSVTRQVLRQNSLPLEAYYNHWRRLGSLIQNQGPEISGAMTSRLTGGTLVDVARGIADARLANEPNQARRQQRISQMIQDPVGLLQVEVAGFDQLVGAPREVLLRAFGTVQRIQEVRAIINRVNEQIRSTRQQLKQAVEEQVGPVERALYQALRESPQYQRCLSANRPLQQAREACRRFQMTRRL